ncbi:MAG: single-stranded DNA-binding protein [Myxococcota bacterium]
MGTVNKVMLVGNLGHDPEIKQLDSGRSVCNFRIATTERWRKKENGEVEERTEWHRVAAWGKQAEVVAKYLSKGRKVCVEGRLQTRTFTDRDGVERRTTEIIADRVTFLDGKRSDEEPVRDAA